MFGFVIYALLYWGVEFLVFLNLEVSTLADINTGIISGIWNLVPLFMAVLDYLFYRQVLNKYHIVGVVSLVLCAFLITVASNQDVQQSPVIVALDKDGNLK